MHLREEQWDKAYSDFFEVRANRPISIHLSRVLFSQAFKNYDECGSSKKITCLKYLVLANMLMKSNVDPFEAQEACHFCVC